tara:strand:+ start:255 stop:1514 length:1260 start_codon:yes stop_codon:yes gene_type:complete
LAKVIPFKAYRASRDKVHLVASRSYISYSKKALISKLDENPYTFLHILNPEYKTQKKTEANSVERFEKVKTKFQDFVDQKILIQDDAPSYYIYRQIKEGHVYLGIIACASVEDYFNRVIKKHEATIAYREEIFKNYLKTVEINAEPVCFTYPNHSTIDKITQTTIKNLPEYDFTTTNKDQHTFWVINNQETVKQLKRAFSEVDSIYIADGHHRSASSALLGKELKESNPNHKGDEDYNFFMGYFIPEKELKIYEFNRLITDLGQLSTSSFLTQIQKNFEVTEINASEFVPKQNHEIGMYLEGKWYCLIPKKELYDEKNVVDSLDVSILTNHLLAPILGIEDLRTNERIYFKGGLDGVTGLMAAVNKGKAKVAFSHFPVSMQQLKAIADADQIMPPKSTWIEPKLRSGLTVYRINEFLNL